MKLVYPSEEVSHERECQGTAQAKRYIIDSDSNRLDSEYSKVMNLDGVSLRQMKQQQHESGWVVQHYSEPAIPFKSFPKTSSRRP